MKSLALTKIHKNTITLHCFSYISLFQHVFTYSIATVGPLASLQRVELREELLEKCAERISMATAALAG